MSSDFDPTDFVDNDFQARKASATMSPATPASRVPTREEVDSKVLEAQQRLAELKRAQEELERERASLEETRRRRVELQTGREEMLTNLTRGIGLIEEAEFAARRDAEQMARTLADFRDALAKVEGISEEQWTNENFTVELARASTIIENARMEWNAARLKLPVLSGEVRQTVAPKPAPAPATALNEISLGRAFKLGLALTWPLTVAVLALLVVLVLMFWKQ